jgi:hypothetical protein
MQPITSGLKDSAEGADCSLLVISCDAYSDLWGPFFKLLRRHWPDCPFPVFFGSGTLACDEPGVTTLFSNGGVDWSQCVVDYLAELKTDYVLIMLDDFFLRKKVSNEAILHCLAFARRHQAIQVRLAPRPGPTAAVAGEPHIGHCDRDLPYRLSTQPAIWHRTSLMDLLRPGESIWKFEHAGNDRARAMERGFYAAKRVMLPYIGLLSHHVVEKGRWLPFERWIFGRQNLGCDFARRKTMPLSSALVYQTVLAVDSALGLLPWRMKSALKKGGKRLLAPLLHRQFEKMSGSRSSQHNRRKPKTP